MYVIEVIRSGAWGEKDLVIYVRVCVFFFSRRRRHTILQGDWSSDVCSSDLDLIFLDIHLPKISGIDFLKTLTNSPNVILTTAFSDRKSVV